MNHYQHLFYSLLGSCLLLLGGACSSTTGSNPVTLASSTAHPGPTVTATSMVMTTPLPTQTPVLTVTFGCHSGSKEGFFADQSHAFACVRTLPGASLTISVSYCNGNIDQSSSLKGTFTADSTGYYQWDWKPLASCQNGPTYWSGKATVTARLDGQTATSGSSFQVD
jgi:hypothetical protein